MHDARDTGRARAKPDFQPAITLFRQIAARSGDAMLTEGSVNADYQLLDLCAEALHHLTAAEQAYAARRANEWIHLQGGAREAAKKLNDELLKEWYDRNDRGRPAMARIAKMKATATAAAGIYAKAAVVRASKTGAAGLAMTLAQDLLDCPGLRAVLWSTGETRP
jgi:hypothetical protein